MSTKCTVLLSEPDNEHWYQETPTAELVLEFGPQHLVERFDDGGFQVTIQPDTALHAALRQLLQKNVH
jgi:hypothetical protein